MFFDEAFDELSKKFECLPENLAPSKFNLSQPAPLIKVQAFNLSDGFLKVLPLVFIFSGCEILFFYI